MSPKTLAAVNSKTRAILPVSLFGLPSPIDELTSHLEGRGIAIIEDAAQSIGGYRVEKADGLVAEGGAQKQKKTNDESEKRLGSEGQLGSEGRLGSEGQLGNEGQLGDEGDGTLANKKMSGGIAPISTTSFFPAKPLGCYGDGGGCNGSRRGDVQEAAWTTQPWFVSKVLPR